MKRVLATIAVTTFLGCGGGGDSTAPRSQGTNTPPPVGGISVTNDAFTPASKSVAAGTTVRWAWNSCTGDPYYGGQTCTGHSVTFDDGTTSAVQDEGTFSRTFDTPGTYNYHCSVHGAAVMSGTITVQ